MALNKVTISKIKQDVRIALGENENVEQLLQGEGIYDDQMQLERDTLVDSLITDGIDRVNTMAPLAMVSDVAEEVELDWNDEEDYCVSAELPKDFLRFVCAKCDCWKKKIYNAIDQDTEEYNWQRSDFESIRASYSKPVVAIVPNELGGGIKIEMFPKNYEEDPSVCIIRKSAIDTDNKVVVSEFAYRAVVYMIASLYYVTINEAEKSKYMAIEAAEVLGLSMKQE